MLKAVIGSKIKSPVNSINNKAISETKTKDIAKTWIVIISTPLVRIKIFSCADLAWIKARGRPSNLETKLDEIAAPRRLKNNKIFLERYIDKNVRVNKNPTAIIASTNTISGLLMNTGGSLYLCNYDGGGAYYFGGSVAFFHVYNRALNSGEVLQNFYAVRGRFGI